MRVRRYRNRRIGDFLKELQLIEGRNTGIPTAIQAIKQNKAPLPVFLTDEDRTFFSVIMNIHPSFLQLEKSKVESKRRSRNDIKDMVLESLKESDKSLTILYQQLGYSGNPSKSFRDAVQQLIEKDIIGYKDKLNVHSSKNVLTIKVK